MNFLLEATLLLATAAIAAPLGKVSRMGSVLAFVGAGVLIGPWGLGLIRDGENILHFAEIGVVFLLFLIGLELHPRRLWALRKPIFGTGSLQLVLTTLALFLPLHLIGVFSWQPALVISYGLALSSTAFALRLLADKQELRADQGKLAFGVLLFQDLAIIPFLAMMPLLAGNVAVEEPAHGDFPLWGAIAIFIAYLLIGRYLLIPFLRLVAWTREQEAFTATALLLVIGSALLMESIGLSMGLGAFLAGVLMADSEYRHQLEADIAPFKGLLLGLFFIAVGMSTNISILVSQFTLIIGGVIALIVIKFLLLFGIGRFRQLNNTQSARFAAYLCQGGEFGFVLFTMAGSMQIISADMKDILVLTVTLSMVLTPFVLMAVSRLFKEGGLSEKELDEMKFRGDQSNAIVIAGFGRFGQVLGRVLNAQGIPYTAIDSNPEQVKLVREFGNKVYYGDLSRHALLETANVGDARIFVLCMDNIEISLKITRVVKKYYPALKIFARARNRFHEIQLRKLQVDYVIRDTLLSGLELTRNVLIETGENEDRIRHIIDTFRAKDTELIERQLALQIDDKQGLIQTAQEAAEELKALLSDEGKSADNTGETSGGRS